MPEPRKTQKQIARRYAGNLQYYNVLASLRKNRKFLVIGAFIVGSIVAVVAVKLGRSEPRLEWINSSGPISEAHAGIAQNCAACHVPEPKIDAMQVVASAETVMDQACLKCHVSHTFHRPNVMLALSCVSCHHEHLGSGPMKQVADANCLICHGDAKIMAASTERGAHLPAGDFLIKPVGGLVYFQPPRPAEGRTEVIRAFDTDHPDFQIQRDRLSDPNTLKFNHKVHLSINVQLHGQKLDCAFCHQPDAHNAYKEPITFAKNCQICHALQLDPDPDLAKFQLPHPQSPDSGITRNFIITLPEQLENFALQQGETAAEAKAFVNAKLRIIRQRNSQGAGLLSDVLVQNVFYSDARKVRLQTPAPGEPPRALFPGCAYCHEVKTVAGKPVVTPPVTPDRWYIHARFDHAAHATVGCVACHGQIQTSVSTADISLPGRASCIVCHSAKGGVSTTCVSCHGYHNSEPTPGNMAAAPPLLRDTLLARH